MMSSQGLQRAQAWATLFATIAVPIVVALLGFTIQRSISTESIRKDYVQLAVGILSNQNSDPRLRVFATEILAKNSPVPFTSDVRDSFVAPGLKLLPDIAKTPMMTSPALPWVEPPKVSRPEDMKSFFDNYAENMKRATNNYNALIHLRSVIEKTAVIEESYWKEVEASGDIGAPVSDDTEPTH